MHKKCAAELCIDNDIDLGVFLISDDVPSPQSGRSTAINLKGYKMTLLQIGTTLLLFPFAVENLQTRRLITRAYYSIFSRSKLNHLKTLGQIL